MICGARAVGPPGATAGLIGRPHLGKLAVAGEAGGARVLGIIRSEIDPALALGG